ncbi:DEAD/DEAH box helicase [Tessaracoccus palaemonis]|uniref:DEAD/DEAH box helicase n=1 Tax=Tessaracoccus palaemonis TaxID=2829499 RepID=A0ABX8SGZ5_9ACTN|nr:DEAD/DEAH box helicase [Tessaracoccus palaemonis]QXT62656.1 DEAD/DEAH box helicase [Tessaracoccus palaemonis]
MWKDFLARPADYFALISELGFNTEDEAKTHGDIPVEIIEAVRKVELDITYFTANLRGYQQFAARFAIAQERVIIGDEMGLGKTVEAISVLAHLRAKGEYFFLVICPAAVVTNWVREVRSKSRLTPHRLHGPGRDDALSAWVRRGGVGVTTFESLRWLEGECDLDKVPLGCVIVDEAHYIKNPAAQRTTRTLAILERTRRSILMTGTPMENRLDEFRTLVHYVRPDLNTFGAGMSARKFRRQVAPVYLRRNQEDVLRELPELVEVDEVLPLSVHDADRYRQAAIDSSFMGLRQAAMLEGSRSMKMQRLLEIVQEAEQDGRKVIVFSHFLAVLEEVETLIPGKTFGILSGRVSPVDRQRMVDDFTKAKGGGVLISQIIAGGVGLNIQAASVIIICEPQIKPTTEWQAIARARRMGQLNSVQVHRLISEEGVDQRITQLLAEKAHLFEAFARDSDIAQHAPEAYDVSEADLARDVVAAERERLLSKPTSPVRSDEGEELPVA